MTLWGPDEVGIIKIRQCLCTSNDEHEVGVKINSLQRQDNYTMNKVCACYIIPRGQTVITTEEEQNT